MNGPEHYTEAERLVSGDASDQAAALVHATLAVAASMSTTVQYEGEGDLVALYADPGWEDVLGFARIAAGESS